MATRTWAWLTDSLHRLAPGSSPRRGGTLGLQAAKGEQVSCQLGVRTSGNNEPVTVRLSCKSDSGIGVRIRRVGFVPVPHYNTPVIDGHYEGRLGGYVGDPLFEEDSLLLWPGETAAFWITVVADRTCRPGPKRVQLAADFGGEVRHCELLIHVCDVTLRKRKDFPVTHWFYADALCDFYGVEPFSEGFWPIFRRYVSDIVSHHQDTLYVPVFTPPLDGVKRPTQLLKVRRRAGGRYAFDFADLRRWIRTAGRRGVRQFEFNHLFTQWGAANAIRIYHGQGADEQLLWPAKTPATGKTYRDFLTQYLPALKRFLQREGIMDRCFFHLSDEPHGPVHQANYARARRMLTELAPWMTVMDALSEVEFARKGLVDMPIPTIRTVREFLAEDIPCWTYFCCNPRGKYLNRLMDTPLAKIRMSGWLFYRTGVLGFLHWGYNYWYKRQSRQLIDPFTVSDACASPEWPYGDTFMVYPGQAGPIDSVRWEVFAESLQDYALLQTLGVDRNGRLLAAIRDYDNFPFSPAWIAGARRKLFA
ncbi:MAG: DUF4091 domain-containing protein [Planctomycetota bacterium]|nr:DUF4091 domain-containing protein [Planctomycetota bacterium]